MSEANRRRASAALSVLKGQADSAADDHAKNDIITKAQAVAHEIQTLDTDVGHDEESMATAGAWLGEVTKALDHAAQRLADARRNLVDAQLDNAARRSGAAAGTAHTRPPEAALRHHQRQRFAGVALGAMRNAMANAHKQAARELEALAPSNALRVPAPT